MSTRLETSLMSYVIKSTVLLSCLRYQKLNLMSFSQKVNFQLKFYLHRLVWIRKNGGGIELYIEVLDILGKLKTSDLRGSYR